MQKRTFADAIEDEYYFEMFIDDLPMYGYVGEVRTRRVSLSLCPHPLCVCGRAGIKISER